MFTLQKDVIQREKDLSVATKTIKVTRLAPFLNCLRCVIVLPAPCRHCGIPLRPWNPVETLRRANWRRNWRCDAAAVHTTAFSPWFVCLQDVTSKFLHSKDLVKKKKVCPLQTPVTFVFFTFTSTFLRSLLRVYPLSWKL